MWHVGLYTEKRLGDRCSPSSPGLLLIRRCIASGFSLCDAPLTDKWESYVGGLRLMCPIYHPDQREYSITCHASYDKSNGEPLMSTNVGRTPLTPVYLYVLCISSRYTRRGGSVGKNGRSGINWIILRDYYFLKSADCKLKISHSLKVVFVFNMHILNVRRKVFSTLM